MRQFHLILLLSVGLLAGCATAPEGVTYMEFGEDTPEVNSRLKGGLDEEESGSDQYDIAVVVFNARKEPANFTLSVEDAEGARTIWRNERIPDGISFIDAMKGMDPAKDEKDREKIRAATRVAIITVNGLTATITVNGDEYPITLIEDHSRLWMVVLEGDLTAIKHFDMD